MGLGASSIAPQAFGLNTTAAFASIIPSGVPKFSEMGMFGWLLVDLAINWSGWAVAALLKVGPTCSKRRSNQLFQ